MKTKNIFKTVALAMLMPAMLLTTACSNDDDVVNTSYITNKGYALPVTVSATRGDGATRASFNQSTGKLSFSAGDKLFVEGRDNDGAEYFAGVLDYVPATGKFSGTIYTQNEWLGTADELFEAANADQNEYVPSFIATLLPAGYGEYGYFDINDKGDAYAYNDRVKINNNYTLATSKAAGVEQLSREQATVYDNCFALAPENPILNFTVTGLEANTDVNVLVKCRVFSSYIGTKTIKSDGDGKVTFVACYPYGNDLQDCIVTVDGTPITIVTSKKNVQKGNIYNITRVKPIAKTWNLSDAEFSGYISLYGGFTHEGVMLKGEGNMHDGNLSAMGDGITFTNTLGKKFKSIVISTGEYGMADIEGDGWSGGTWTGDATSVTMTGGIADGITSITFLLGD